MIIDFRSACWDWFRLFRERFAFPLMQGEVRMIVLFVLVNIKWKSLLAFTRCWWTLYLWLTIKRTRFITIMNIDTCRTLRLRCIWIIVVSKVRHRWLLLSRWFCFSDGHAFFASCSECRSRFLIRAFSLPASARLVDDASILVVLWLSLGFNGFWNVSMHLRLCSIESVCLRIQLIRCIDRLVYIWFHWDDAKVHAVRKVLVLV